MVNFDKVVLQKGHSKLALKPYSSLKKKSALDSYLTGAAEAKSSYDINLVEEEVYVDDGENVITFPMDKTIPVKKKKLKHNKKVTTDAGRLVGSSAVEIYNNEFETRSMGTLPKDNRYTYIRNKSSLPNIRRSRNNAAVDRVATDPYQGVYPMTDNLVKSGKNSPKRKYQSSAYPKESPSRMESYGLQAYPRPNQDNQDAADPRASTLKQKKLSLRKHFDTSYQEIYGTTGRVHSVLNDSIGEESNQKEYNKLLKLKREKMVVDRLEVNLQNRVKLLQDEENKMLRKIKEAKEKAEEIKERLNENHKLAKEKKKQSD